ncbi:single-strand selective monofunctional uracil-DNA glycosylase isoform X3 [Bactrocera dorsalis]|uniref:Single-strand selective monofunctional uracil-DNA glycosylase isoform X3 n=1 Tax=Bactrocera dorsalis TaxID=27457 RepID=A0ABM3J1N5_BACDO|nr:single-strand selective monofunctional uracil-DNA glycosylase isoform X3 [Bactrocera dorsalis]
MCMIASSLLLDKIHLKFEYIFLLSLSIVLTMSRETLIKEIFSGAASVSTGESVLSLNSLQKFAATRKRHLSLQPDSSDSQQTSTSKRYGPKRVVFVGMNPGPNGMGQTGVPFGNILTVRNEMGLSGTVMQPPSLHLKRPVDGLECIIEEPSGVRIWGLFKKLAGGSLMTFGRNCFVHNFCPLIFYDKAGKNITPSELKGDYKAIIGKLCLDALDKEQDLLEPEILVPIGAYIKGIIKRSRHVNSFKVCTLHHPSPRALNNQNWPERAEELLHKYDLVKYISNEV